MRTPRLPAPGSHRPGLRARRTFACFDDPSVCSRSERSKPLIPLQIVRPCRVYSASATSPPLLSRRLGAARERGMQWVRNDYVSPWPASLDKKMGESSAISTSVSILNQRLPSRYIKLSRPSLTHSIQIFVRNAHRLGFGLPEPRVRWRPWVPRGRADDCGSEAHGRADRRAGAELALAGSAAHGFTSPPRQARDPRRSVADPSARRASSWPGRPR